MFAYSLPGSKTTRIGLAGYSDIGETVGKVLRAFAKAIAICSR